MTCVGMADRGAGAGLGRGFSYQQRGLVSSKSPAFTGGKTPFKEVLNLRHRGILLQELWALHLPSEEVTSKPSCHLFHKINDIN